MFDLSEKTALVTGASSGLCARFACCLARAGARVVLAARRLSQLETLASELGNAIVLEMDVANRASVQRSFSWLEETGERIDICINNAGIFKETAVFESDEEGDFDTVMQTNVMGVWYVTQFAACHMKRHHIHGSLINISSVNGADRLHPRRTAYCASKAAVIQMTKALVGELSPHQIRVNCIVPGPFRTPATEYKAQTEELERAFEASIPLGFFADPEELDGMILYLASNEASRYTTGGMFTVDGGVSWGGLGS